MLRCASFGRCTFLADPVFAQNSEKQRRNSQGFRCSVVGLDWSQPRVSAENVTLLADNSAAITAKRAVGWAHSKFGRHEGRDVESLIVEVAQTALADAGVAAADVDTIYLGRFVRQEFPASLVFQADPALRFKPATRVEDACATGSAAIHQGLNAIAAGRARLALIVGVEKMTEVSGAQVGDILLGASYRKEEDAIEGRFAGIFGKIAQSYFQRYGDQSDALARIAAKNHKNGVANPLAQMQKDLGYEFCRTVSDKNPIVAGPLKRTDCSLVRTAPQRSCSPMRRPRSA
jgi:acetyl-CoA C-acetyltransferase